MDYLEYNMKEMEQFLKMTSGLYDIVRLVDPLECREMTIKDGDLLIKNGCYNVWESSQRCKNCSSYKSCVTGLRKEKEEFFEDQVFHILSNPVKLAQEDGTVLSCVIEFITAHKATVEEKGRVNDRRSETYEPATLIDALTGLYNWDGFHQKARAYLDAHKDSPNLIIACDIMQFNMVNSIFGRERANEILIDIGQLLLGFAPQDAVVARLQADQFAICMEKAEYEEAALLDVITQIDRLLDDSAFRMHFTAGVFEVIDDAIPVSVMFDRAVMALVQNRSDHSRQISWFTDSMLQELLYQQEITSGFERTLRSGEYQIFIQAQVDADGVCQGGEALARWIRPNGEIVPPFQFIPVLEKAGLIAQLDRYVWEQAVQCLKRWEGTDLGDLYLSVNISALDFYYINVYETVTALTDKYGIDRSRLKLEITETAIMSDSEKQILKVHELREAGFVVEIDDFGTGYSSLSMLKDIEADVLKIDMSFLRETDHDERSRKVLRSIVDMAEKLGMDTVTEGVETKEQLAMLTKMGCNLFQGFYFARPVPVGEFEAFARESRK